MALMTVNDEETGDFRSNKPVVSEQEAGRGAAPAAGREARGGQP